MIGRLLCVLFGHKLYVKGGLGETPMIEWNCRLAGERYRVDMCGRCFCVIWGHRGPLDEAEDEFFRQQIDGSSPL